jgi:hypothetical protein
VVLAVLEYGSPYKREPACTETPLPGVAPTCETPCFTCRSATPAALTSPFSCCTAKPPVSPGEPAACPEKPSDSPDLAQGGGCVFRPRRVSRRRYPAPELRPQDPLLTPTVQNYDLKAPC